VTGEKTKGKQFNSLAYSVIYIYLRNGLVPDPERLQYITKKHLTEHMPDVVACPWSEGQGGDLDGKHSALLTHALITFVGKQNDAAFRGNTMDTQWKQVAYYFELIEDSRRSHHTVIRSDGL
jgi:hypothetical protein